MVRLLSAPWQSGTGHPVAATPLPGLRSEVIRDLASSNPGILNAELRQWLRMSCGIAHTAIGDIDFTGQWYPEEPLAVLRPCLTLTMDDEGRRWVAEAVEGAGLPGPVWCVFPHPTVTVYVSDDLGRFLYTLYERTRRGQTLAWLQGLIARRGRFGPSGTHPPSVPATCAGAIVHCAGGCLACPSMPASTTCEVPRSRAVGRMDLPVRAVVSTDAVGSLCLPWRTRW
jgi:hypothetical protein